MSDTPSDTSSPLDEPQVALLNAIVERLIPSDELGPGAREAHAARYIVGALASDYRRHLADYVAGLARVDALADAAYGVPFVGLEPDRQEAILAQVDSGEDTPLEAMPRTFFDLLLKHTREGVFGDPRWGGNADRIGWNLIGYGGPRYTWSADDQRIEFIGSDIRPDPIKDGSPRSP